MAPPDAGGFKDAPRRVQRDVHRALALGAVLGAGLEQLLVRQHDGVAGVDDDDRAAGDPPDERGVALGDEIPGSQLDVVGSVTSSPP